MSAVVPSAVESIVQPVPSSAAAQSVAPSSAAATTPPVSSAQPSPEPSSAAPQSSAAPESSAAPQSPSPQPTSAPASSAAAQSPSPQATSQAAAQSSAAPTSQAVSEAAASQSQAASQASVAASSAAESVTAATSAATSQLTSAVDVTTTDASGKVVTTRPEVLTQTSISTDGSGKVYTVTQVVHQPTGALDSSGRNGGTEGFFDNTGAVAGVFVVLGLALTAGVLAFVFFMLRRRRRQRLDRDVAAAAAAAAAGAHHSNRSAFDDDGYDEEKSANPAHTQYGGYYAATDIHGQPQPSMGQYDYEDPAGGYDHYANNLPPPGDRTSTATAAGMAGFGAQSAQTNYSNQNMYTHAEDYEEVADHNGYNAMSGGGHSQMQEGQRASNGGEFYFDPKQAGQYDYVEEDAYAYNDQPPRRARSGSEGSVARDAAAERALRVANE